MYVHPVNPASSIVCMVVTQKKRLTSELIKDMRNKVIKEKELSITRNLLVLNRLPYEEIADPFDLSADDIKALDREKTV